MHRSLNVRAGQTAGLFVIAQTPHLAADKKVKHPSQNRKPHEPATANTREMR